MKILYGIQTTGNGHIVRAREMIPVLRSLGCKVETILSGDSSKKIPDRHIFEPSQVKEGLTFVSDKGKIKYLQTLKELSIVNFYTDVFSYKPKNVDLIITDYEPITSRIAKRHKIPSIGIGHMYSFQHDVPMSEKSLIGKLVMQQFAPVQHPIGLHWHHFNQPILPPTIPDDIQFSEEIKEDKILVYLPFEDLENVKRLLKKIKSHAFYVYSNIKEPYQDSNIFVRPFSRKNFVKDLSECDGLICNTGFSLVSEALHLGKKILTKPLAGQIEQESNALALEQLGLGRVVHELVEKDIREWLDTAPPEPMQYPEVIKPLARWIVRGKWHDHKSLVDDLWEKSGLKQKIIK